jgi:hypothetical protein
MYLEKPIWSSKSFPFFLTGNPPESPNPDEMERQNNCGTAKPDQTPKLGKS